MAEITITIKIDDGQVAIKQGGASASARTSLAPTSQRVVSKRSLSSAFDQSGGSGSDTEN